MKLLRQAPQAQEPQESRGVREVRDAARDARTAGRAVFTPLFNPRTGLSGLGSPDEWSLMVEAVESEGWRLEHWQVAPSNRAADGLVAAYPVFRRAA